VVGVCARADELGRPTIVQSVGRHAVGLRAGQARVRHDSHQGARLEVACPRGPVGAAVVLGGDRGAHTSS